MSRSTKQPTNLPPPSYTAPEGYNDTESEYDPTDVGSDPPEYDTDRDRSARDRRDQRRDVDVGSPRRVPTGPSIIPKENDFSESDPRQGLNPTARRFIDHNVVNTNFLAQSADYLRRNRTLRDQDVSEWRQRARCAVRGGDPSLARKLIQQAQLIKLWQDTDAIGDLARGEHSPYFPWFIQRTYTRYLTYLTEAEDDGLLEGRRKEMLEPWARFVYQAWNEDITKTLSLSPGSVSSTWISSSNNRIDTRPSLVNTSRNSVPSLSKPPQNSRKSSGGQEEFQRQHTPRDHRSSGASLSLPIRGSNWVDEEETLLPPSSPASSLTKSESRGSGARYERKDTEYREAATKPSKQVAAVKPKTTSKHHRYPSDPPRKSQKSRYEDVAEDPEEDEEREEDEEGEGEQEEEEESDDGDDGDDGDDDDNDDDSGQEQEADKRTGRPLSELRDQRAEYEYANGTINSQLKPRTLPLSNQTVKTRSVQGRGTPKAVTSGRSHDLTPVKSQSPTSTVTPTTIQPASSLQDLSELMRGFIAQKTFQDCRDFCKSNPKIFEQDLRPLQVVAMECLRQGRDDAATRLIERRLMLRDAIDSNEGNLEWMKKLPEVRRRQEILRNNCKIVLEALEAALPAVPTSSERNSGVGPQRRNGPDTNRANAPRQGGQQFGHNTKATNTLRS